MREKEKRFGEVNYGVPLTIRKECVEKIQETQLTAIIGKTEIDELIKRLKKLITIRNAIMHCRGQ